MAKAGVVATGPSPKKASVRAAFVGLDPACVAVLQDCFKQFGIQCVVVGEDAARRLNKEKFEACVVRLGPSAEPILEAVRSSPSNSRIVIYGVGSLQHLVAVSKYGINSVFTEPVERAAALKIVRATHLLVVHEFRRYVRIPVTIDVRLDAEGRKFACTSQEISAGGMSLATREKHALGKSVELTFELPGTSQVRSRGSVCWVHPSENLIGVRFDSQDNRRLAVKQWIESYLEIT
jgi:Tfp pilus assembly protein PilZ